MTNSDWKSLRVDEVFGPALLTELTETMIHAHDDGRNVVDAIAPIIEEHIGEINKSTGQENSPRFLAYAMEAMMNQFYAEKENSNGNQ